MTQRHRCPCVPGHTQEHLTHSHIRQQSGQGQAMIDHHCTLPSQSPNKPAPQCSRLHVTMLNAIIPKPGRIALGQTNSVLSGDSSISRRCLLHRLQSVQQRFCVPQSYPDTPPWVGQRRRPAAPRIPLESPPLIPSQGLLQMPAPALSRSEQHPDRPVTPSQSSAPRSAPAPRPRTRSATGTWRRRRTAATPLAATHSRGGRRGWWETRPVKPGGVP